LRYVYRLLANLLPLYLALFLMDTMLAPHFYLRRMWIVLVLSVLLSAINSTIKPFPRFKMNRGRAFGFFGLTALGNYLLMQIISSLGAPLTGNPIAFMLAAVFLTLVTGLVNHVVGFKPKEQPKIVTREGAMSQATKEHLAAIDKRRRERRKRHKD
jgi:uncharacterized membrane protein YvlD (DUF360 family)